MKIVKARLVNFRRFTNTEISFDTPLTALVGKNNSGKSSLLEVLAIMLQAQAGPMSLSRKIGNSGRITIELHLQFNEGEWSEIIGSMQSSHISYSHKYIDLNTMISKFVQTSLIYRCSADMRDGTEHNSSRTICFDNITLPSDFPDACKNVDTLVSPIILGEKNLSSLAGLLYISSEPQTSEVEKFIPFDDLTKGSDRTKFIRNNLYHLMKSEPDKYDYLVKKLSSVLENILEIDTRHNEDTGNIDLKLLQGD
jgi:energy-coupling factor transporter ATP-binding protein EcfA2